MKNQFRAILRPFLALLCCLVVVSSCKTISAEKTHSEQEIKYIYQDRLQRDSIYVQDSIFLYTKNDTVYQEKIKYIFKNKISTDTVIKIDTLRVKDIQEKVIEKKVKNPVNIFLVIYLIFSVLAVGLWWKSKK